MITAFKQYLATLKLSPVSRKLYLSDVRRFLSTLGSTPTLDQVKNPMIYAKYLDSLRASALAPSMLKRTLASLKQFGAFLSLTYSLPNPTMSFQLPATNSQLPTPNYLKHFTNYLNTQHLSPLTIKSYKSDISRYLEWDGTYQPSTKFVEVLNEKNIKKYLNHLRDSTSTLPSTIERKSRSITRFKDWYTNIYTLSNLPDNTPATNYQLLTASDTPATNYQLPTTNLSPDQSPFSVKKFNYRSLITLVVLLLFTATLAIFGYRQFSRDVRLTAAFPSTPVTPNRQLSFQGRLENAGGTPITTATNFIFKLFTASSGGTELYSSGTCSITPDADGVFNTQIGSTCGSGIASSVFTENSNVWLEVTVVAETLTPRQQIATVAYALNSETIQGFPLSSTVSAIRNTVVPMNQWGEIIVGEQSPRLKGVAGTFQISAPALSLITTAGTNGNISFAPDGTGQINATGNTTSTNFFNISNAQLTTGSLITGTAANNNTGFKLIDLLSGSSPTSKFSVTDAGTVTLAGDLTVSGTSATLPNNSISPNEIFTTSQTDEYCLTYESTGGTWEWQTCGAGGGGSTNWRYNLGTLSPLNDTVDLLVGANATSSAKAGFVNINSSTPTATVSAGTAGGAYLTAAGTLATTAMQSLTLGNGTTGNVVVANNLLLTAATNLIFGSTNLAETTAANDSGAYLVGSFDEFANSNSVNVQDVLDDLDASLSTALTGASIWTDGGAYLYPTAGESLGNSAAAGSNKIASIYLGDSSPLVFGTDNDFTFSFDNSASTLGSTLTGGTRLGINTTSALATVDIRSSLGTIPVASISGTTAQSTLIVDQSGIGDILTASSSGEPRFVVKSNGNVGIGVASPTTKLQVGGTSSTISNSSGDLTIDSFTGNVVFATDDDLIPTLGAGSADLGSLTLPWDNLYTGAAYFAGGTTYFVDATGNAKFLDLIVADTANPGLTVGNGSIGFAKIGGSTISDNTGDLTLDSDSLQTVISDDLAISGGNVTTATTFDSTLTVTGTSTFNGLTTVNDDLTVALTGNENIEITDGATPTTDTLSIISNGATITADTNALEIDFTTGDGTDVTNSGLQIDLASGGTAATDIINAINLTMDAADASTQRGINFADNNFDLDLNALTDLTLGVGGTGETILTASALSPATTDGNALGTSSLMWSDLFLADTGVINFNNGGSTITYTSATDQLDFAASDYNFTTVDGETIDFAGDGTPTVDLIQITGGTTTDVAGTDALSISISAVNGTNRTVNLINGSLSAAGTVAGDIANGLYLDLASQAGGTETAIKIQNTAAWNNDIDFQFEETLSNATDDQLLFTGVGGTNNTSLTIDLDGATTTVPTLVGGASNLVSVFDNFSIGIDGAITENIAAAGFVFTGDNNLYVEGMAGINGAVYIDGAVDMASNLTMSGTAANIILGSNYLSGDGGDEGIFIDSSGYVGVATTTPRAALEINTFQSYTIPGTHTGAAGAVDWATGLGSTARNSSILASNAIIGNSVFATSDERLKQDINPINSDLVDAFFDTVNPVSFKWIADQTLDSGFIAQDLINKGFGYLLSAIPDSNMVEYTNSDGYTSPAGMHYIVNYNSIVPILAAGIQKNNLRLDNFESSLANDLLSPLAPDQPIAITGPVQIKPSQANPPAGEAGLPNTANDPLLVVEGEIDASTISARLAKLEHIEAENITAKNIVADTITANHIEGLDAKIATLSAGISDSDFETITDRIKARLLTLSEVEGPTAQDVPVPEPDNSPNVANLPNTANSDFVATSSASIDFATINNYLAVIGTATITTLEVTDHLYATEISSKTGLLALGENTLLVDSTGQVMVNGDLTVSGTITASQLNLERLNIYDESGAPVATIDASGSANLASLTTGMITIAAPAVATQSGLASLLGTAQSNATAGQNILLSPNTELIIESPYVTPNSLVYLTPTSNTDNKVLFVKSKVSCPSSTIDHQPLTIPCTPSFTIGIDAPSSSDISFNWWIIELKP